MSGRQNFLDFFAQLLVAIAQFFQQLLPASRLGFEGGGKDFIKPLPSSRIGCSRFSFHDFSSADPSELYKASLGQRPIHVRPWRLRFW